MSLCRAVCIPVSVLAILCSAALAGDKPVGWRGDGSGIYSDAKPPLTWNKTAGASKNIAWATPLPGPGIAQPILLGDKIFVLSEFSDLVCLDKKSGKILWLRSNTYFDTLSPKEASDAKFKEAAGLAKQIKAIDDSFGTAAAPDAKRLGERFNLEKALIKAMEQADPERFTYALDVNASNGGATAPTPCTDGKNIYVWLGSGVAARYDADGHRKWILLDNHERIEHGFNASPVLVGDKFIVYMRDMTAFNAADGKVLWRTPITPKTGQYLGQAHSSLLSVKIGGEDYVVCGTGDIVKASDGKVAYHFPSGMSTYATPVIDGNMLYCASAFGRCMAADLTGGGKDLKPAVKKSMNLYASDIGAGVTTVASPLVFDGLFYCVDNNGELAVLDTRDWSVVYKQKTDAGPRTHARNAWNEYTPYAVVNASLALADGHIFITGTTGTVVIIEPGRQYKEVGRNKITDVMEVGSWRQHPEMTFGAPVFEGDRVYLRAEGHLYCVAAK